VPIYEYLCNQCNKEFSVLILTHKDLNEVCCTNCKGKDIKRLLSRFAVHQTEEARLAEFDTSKPQGDEFYKDSRNIGLWAKKRARELGADLGPQFDEVVEKARTGKILEDYDI
jgi:putative FmdB family regulatory protein